MGERRSRYHFVSLWITMAAGFTYLFLGFQYHDAGYSLPKAVGAGAVAYLVYALPAAYFGSATGQTYSLLTRSILGKVGSALVSVLLIGAAAGWTAFAFNLLATLYDGLFGWDHVVLISVMPFLAGVGVAIGSVMWGNEPDTWRYGNPRPRWPLPTFVIALAVGLVLLVAGGWMMGTVQGRTYRLRAGLPLHRRVLDVRRAVAGRGDRHPAPGGDQRRQLLRDDQRGAERTRPLW